MFLYKKSFSFSINDEYLILSKKYLAGQQIFQEIIRNISLFSIGANCCRKKISGSKQKKLQRTNNCSNTMKYNKVPCQLLYVFNRKKLTQGIKFWFSVALYIKQLCLFYFTTTLDLLCIQLFLGLTKIRLLCFRINVYFI